MRTRYTQQLQQVFAAKYDGSNVSALEEIAPGKIIIQDDKPYLDSVSGLVPIEVTDWVVEDADLYNVMSNHAFSAKFNVANPNPQPTPA